MPDPARSRKTSTAPAAAAPLQRQTLAGMTLEAIRERILSGAYPEGEPLRQDAIAEELGVSRIPIREALRQLEAEGLVVFNPHRGAVVSSLSIGEIEELFELRAQIESDLVRRAVPRVRREDISSAKDTLKAYDVAFRKGEITTWGKLNWEFHATLYAPADRVFTMAVVQRLHQQSDRYMRMQLVLTHGETRASDEHRSILAAVEEGDVRQASQLMRQHILGAGRRLVSVVRAERDATATKTLRERHS